MFEQFFASKSKGDKIVNVLGFGNYTDSVTKNNHILAQMCQMKCAKDLKKADRIIVASGLHNRGEVEEPFEINDTDLLPGDTVEDSGSLIFEVSTPLVKSSLGAEGWNFNMKLLNIETRNKEEVSTKWDLKIDEEVAIFIKDDMKNKRILVLNEGIVLPKAEKKKESKAIGATHLKLFAKIETTEEEGKEGKNTRENTLRTIAIRKSLQWLRTTVGAKQSEMVVQEGGLKKDVWYLHRISAASKEYLSQSIMRTEDDEGKWQGIDNYIRVEGVKIMQDKDAFQDYIVLGVWDVKKRGKLLDQFLLSTDIVDEESSEQLATILTRKEVILKMSHGSIWEGAFKKTIERIGRGALGRVCPPQTRYTIEEAWESISRTLNEDDNIVRSRTAAGIKHYDLEKIGDVINMVKDRFDGIPETTYETENEFRKLCLKSTRKSMDDGKKTSGKKHEIELCHEEEEPYVKKQLPKGGGGGKQTSWATRTSTSYSTKEKGKESKEAKTPWLCMYNLKYQFIGAKEDCKKVGNCGRDHFNKALKGRKDYHWTLKALTEQVQRSSEIVTNKEDKKKIITALQKEFA